MKAARLPVICLIALAMAAVTWKTARSHGSRPAGQPVAALQATDLHQAARPPASVQQPAGPESPTPANAPAAGAVEEKATEERLGPFSISGKNYTVVLHKKHLATSADGAVVAADGVVAVEVVDAAGAVQYQRTYPLEADAEDVSAWTVSAYILKGTNDTGLLMRSRPSKSSGFYEQIFGVVNARLVPFCGPFPEMDVEPDVSGVYRTAGPLGPQADEMRVIIGTGRVLIVVPIRIDWPQGKLTLAPKCPESAASSSHTMCQYQMLDPNSVLQRPKDVTFVRLYSSPNESSGRPERVVVKPASKIDLLAYLADIALTQPDFLHAPLPGEFPVKDMASIGIAPNSDSWLQVRIDGKVGWIHGDEDLDALGLPEPQDEIN